MKKLKTGFLMLLLSLALVACGSEESSSNSDNTESNGETTETAIEGDLSFYTSQPDEDAQKLVDAFKEKYPEVNVQTYRSGTEEVISKIKAEKEAGDVQADVLLVADSVTFEDLKEEDMLLEYKSEELSEIPANLVDADGMYAGTKVMATALVVNTTNVTEMPDSWNVLTEESSKGQTIMPSPFYSGAAAYNLGVLTRNDEFGWGFYESLKANETTITQGNGAVLKAVADGEKSYGMVVDFIVARAAAEGSPVELVYPSEGVPVITEPIGIMKDVENEAAAKAFVDFVLSEEGQNLAAELGYTPIRKGIEAPEGLKSIEDMKVLDADINELYQSREEDKKEFESIFGQ
ncbi:ABC transporter substrate-binding protein [Metabacillus litoralis]|uniref:ABC transporter substrate-binding protein n=1 Tax=Metabacillus litoralis TaxID=152268 RepID=UPI00203ED401|nr:ABC transporter substrate-binding protein [Metabacillus litoralis]MCM3410374.1 ABC transporter substrate-binding protein [Metabacillus litoralis]